MDIDAIVDEWKKDSEIDKTELGDEALRIANLHSKWLRVLTQERLKLLKYEAELKTLRKDKYEFYSQGPTKETNERGWEMPARGIILKNDIPMYMDSDRDVIDMNLKIGYQNEKVTLLTEIMRHINSRGYNIKAAIEWTRFTMGG